jgi:hypothetical protein
VGPKVLRTEEMSTVATAIFDLARGTPTCG